jgi:D-3-phosphoglycerate dehydrogenase/microcystin synthetase protein McyI
MYHEDGEQLLAAHTDVQVITDPMTKQLGISIRNASAVYVLYPSRLSAEVIRAGRSLLVISASGRGTDAIDIPTATDRGIAVVNNPGLGTIPVSEHAVALMLDLAKQITWSDAQVRQGGGWTDRQQSSRIELEGRTLGVIGLGNIGLEVARKCITAFRMRVLVYDPYIPPAKAEAIGATWVDNLSTVLGEADIVSLHPELTEETRGMIAETELRQMRADAFLINTARGPVVNEGALVRALREGWIAGAAIDVFDPEPPPADSCLYDLDKLILSPHIGGITKEARRHLALSAATQILQVLHGERPPNLVNPDIWEQVAARVASGGGVTVQAG